MYTIKNVYAREVLDSRGNPTVEVEITLRDWDKSRYLWKWVLKAVENVNTTIKNAIVWKNFSDYRELDEALLKLDWTKNKSNLWANAILWVSMAFVVACSNSENKQIFEYLGKGEGKVLPVPMMNILNWGSHADNNVDIQEFMIVPVWAKSLKEAVRMWAEVFHNLKNILKARWLATSVGDEGGYAPNLASNEEALAVIIEAIQKAGYTTEQIKLALDVASSEFFKDWKYNLEWEWKILSSAELVDFYKNLCEKYPIISIEDWMAEDDFDGWKMLTEALGSKVMLVWDDLFVTNIERLAMWIEKWLWNAILIKLNQIWTVSETIDAIDMATKAEFKSIISHRSGETEDTFIAHLVVAKNTGFIKTGSLSRTDRIAKYNELMRIEEKIK